MKPLAINESVRRSGPCSESPKAAIVRGTNAYCHSQATAAGRVEQLRGPDHAWAYSRRFSLAR